MTAPDLASYHAVHTALRTAPHRLAEAVRSVDPTDTRRLRALARYWRGYSGEVLAHHTVEDTAFFPALVERVAEAAELIHRTDADHHRLDELMSTCGAGMRRLENGTTATEAAEVAADLDELAALMDAHLDFEDADILPLFERHFSADEYQELEDRAVKSLGFGPQAMFTIPFVMASLSESERRLMLATAPGPLRFLHRVTRRRYARLELLALGPVADRTMVAA